MTNKTWRDLWVFGVFVFSSDCIWVPCGCNKFWKLFIVINLLCNNRTELISVFKWLPLFKSVGPLQLKTSNLHNLLFTLTKHRITVYCDHRVVHSDDQRIIPRLQCSSGLWNLLFHFNVLLLFLHPTTSLISTWFTATGRLLLYTTWTASNSRQRYGLAGAPYR